MLSIGLTGGIAAGKSLLATRFNELGAVLIDADQVARDVVAPGTAGLSAIVKRFGAELLLPDGSLNRPALGALVFADPEARQALNGIVHPLVRDRARELQNAAGPNDIVVQDIPLLVESGQGANFHLVVVVQAPEALRLARMVGDRGMSEDDARARMAAQATDEQRAAVADVVIVNDAEPAHALAELDRFWHERLLPFASNLAHGVPAPQAKETPTHGTTPGLPGRAKRIKDRLEAAVEAQQGVVEPAGPAAEAGEPAGGVLEFMVHVRDRQDLADLGPVLAAAGFPRCPDSAPDAPVHASADPGCPVTVHVHVAE